MVDRIPKDGRAERGLIDIGLRYARAIDNRDFALVLTCFTEDAIWFGRTGHREIEAAMRAFLSRYGTTQHITTNFEPVVLERTGTMRSLYMATHCQLGTGAPFVIGGRYQDRFVSTPGGWRIMERVVHVDWETGLRAEHHG